MSIHRRHIVGISTIAVLAASALSMASTSAANGLTCSDVLNAWSPVDGVEYQVSNPDQLYCLGEVAVDRNFGVWMTRSFRQTQDIDVRQRTVDPGTDWRPIGTNADQFHGTYDGGGFTISGLTYNDPNGMAVGLFSETGRDGKTEIRNLTLVDVDLSAFQDVGALIGIADANTHVSNVHMSGDISTAGGYGDSGGLIGWVNGSLEEPVSVSKSSANVAINAAADTAESWAHGGLVGWSDYLELSDSQAIARITHLATAGGAGGLVGQLATGKILNSTAVVDIVAEGYVGGAVGYASAALIQGVTATGSIQARAYGAGGIVGEADTGDGVPTEILNSTADVSVTGVDAVGGLIGHLLDSSVSDSYSNGNVTATGSGAGGIVGNAEATTLETDIEITRTSATGDVTGVDLVGGIVGAGSGWVDAGTYSTVHVSSSWTSSNVTGAVGATSIGGIAGGGWNSDATPATGGNFTITDVYTTGTVNDGATNVGGVVGYLGAAGSVSRAYSLAPVSPSDGADRSSVGALIGYLAQAEDEAPGSPGARIEALSLSTGDMQPIGNASDSNAVSTTVTSLKDFATFATWNDTEPRIAKTWLATPTTELWGLCTTANAGLPFLQWQFTSNPCPSGGNTGNADNPPATPSSPSNQLKAQSPTKKVKFAKDVKNRGWTKIVRLPITMSSGEQAQVSVRGVPIVRSFSTAGDVRDFKIKRTEKAIKVWLSGETPYRVVVVITAPATGIFDRYIQKKVYRTARR